MDTKTREPRPAKVAVVDEVKRHLDESQATIVTEYRGLTVAELAQLRTSLAASNAEYRVYKNTLVRMAVREKGFEELANVLEGPTAIAFVKGDAVGAAKTLSDFSKGNQLLVLKGGMLGDTFMDADQTKALAKIPPREVLLAQLAGAMQAPMSQFAALLAAVPSKFAYGIKALIDKGGAAA